MAVFMRAYGTLVLWSHGCAFAWVCCFGIVLTMYHESSLLRSNGNHIVQLTSSLQDPSCATAEEEKNCVPNIF
jgi:hypothetical protein